MEDVCPACVEKGICPKCDKTMKRYEEHDAYFCPVHGWDGSEKLEDDCLWESEKDIESAYYYYMWAKYILPLPGVE
jgi:predicted amidophosphoribosyltransferase